MFELHCADRSIDNKQEYVIQEGERERGGGEGSDKNHRGDHMYLMQACTVTPCEHLATCLTLEASRVNYYIWWIQKSTSLENINDTPVYIVALQ